VRRAAIGVAVVFVACGFVFATWASRLVAIRLTLGLDPGQMGLLLLCWSAGSVAAMPLSGRLIRRFGARRVLTGCGCLAAVGLVGAGAAAAAGAVWAVGPLLAALGVGIGVWDVTMNVAATDVEHALARTVMPRFHAGYSLGTVLAGLSGAGLARAGLPVAAHFGAVAAVCLAAVGWGARRLLKGGASDAVRPPAVAGSGPGARPPKPASARQAAAELTSGRPQSTGSPSAGSPSAGRPPAGPPSSRPSSAWLESRVILLGLVVLSLTLAEGAAGDWLASGIVQGFGVPEATGILGLTVFLTVQTAARVFGTRLVDRFGRPAAIRASGICAIAGVALYALAPALPLAFAGAALWGAGAALVFPLGMSAAGDDPARAAARTSVVATIGYGAFLTGPPLLGLLADHTGFRPAMLALAAPAALAVALAQAARRPDAGDRRHRPG
jgi:MFS family permease